MARKTKQTEMTDDQLPDQGNAEVAPNPLAGQPSGKAEDIGETIVFDVQVSPDFERLTEGDLHRWTNQLVKYLRGQGATVRPLKCETIHFNRPVAEGTPGAKETKKNSGDFVVKDHVHEARMEWEYPDSPPVTVVTVNPDKLTAQREAVKMAFQRRYENSPQLAGTGPDMPNPARSAAIPPDQALAALSADEAQAIGLLTPTTAAHPDITNPHQIADQGKAGVTASTVDADAKPAANTPQNMSVAAVGTQPPPNEAPGSGMAGETGSQLTDEQLGLGAAKDADAHADDVD